MEKKHIVDLTQELDEHCLNIVRALLVGVKKYRFNELLRTLNDGGVKMSKPTLSEHLKHLKKKNLVIRKVEGVQSVTYLFNYLKFRDLERTVEEQPQPDEFELKEKQFNSLPLEEQIRHIVYSTIAINLTGLQLRILKALDPKADLMRNLMIMVNSRTHEVCEEWLIENCSKDGEYGRKAVQKLEVYIEKFEGKSPEDLKPEDIPDGAFIF